MSNSFLNELGRRAPQIALAILAGRQGGLEGLGAFQGGMLEAQQRQQALARQAQLDEERQQQQAIQNQRAQSVEARAVEDHKRQNLDRALAYLYKQIERQEQTAADPVAAESVLLGRAASAESMFGVPQGQLSGAIPNMAQAVSRGVRADARQLLDDVEARIRKVNKDAVVDDTTASFKWATVLPRVQRALIERGHPVGQEVKPSQLSELAAMPTLTVPKPKPQPATAGSFEEYVGLPPELQAQRRQQRKEYQQADDRQAQGGGTPYFIPLQTAQGILSFDARTGKESGRVADLKPGETAQRELANAKTTATILKQIIGSVDESKLGPVIGRYKTVEAALAGNDPTFAAFSAAVSTLQNTVINLRTGAQMSEPEARRILNELPNVKLPPATFVARAKQSQKYFEEWLRNRASVAYGRTTTGDVDRMVAPASGDATEKADPLGIR